MLPGTNGTGYTVTAYYGGDGTFAASTASTTGTVSNVNKEPSQVSVNLVTFDANNNPILSTASTSLQYGSSYILLVAVTNSSGTLCVPSPFGTAVPAFGSPLPCPTGAVSLFDSGKALPDFLVPNTRTPTNTSNLNNSGFAEDQPIQLVGGSHSLTATYAGDNSFSANNSSNTLSLTITPAATATSVNTSTASIMAGGSVTLIATVASNSNSAQGPTGTVQFRNGSNALGAAVTCAPTGANFNTNTGALCTATLTTTLSFLTPPATPVQMPPINTSPTWLATRIAAWLTMIALLLLFLLALPRVAPRNRRVYAYAVAVLLLFGCAAVGIAGCGGGGGGGGGGTGHTDTITAVYSGDTNYAGSTSTAIGIGVQ
jgi:hypothetical protein